MIKCYPYSCISAQPFEWPEADSSETVFYDSEWPGESKIFWSLSVSYALLCVTVPALNELCCIKYRIESSVHSSMIFVCGSLSWASSTLLNSKYEFIVPWEYCRKDMYCHYSCSHSHGGLSIFSLTYMLILANLDILHESWTNECCA